MKHFEENGIEVEARDLYEMKFQPVITPEEFYYAKDGTGEPVADVAAEQDLVSLYILNK
ncbi:NAD(P)H-dependent oxidoreductase [Paenibacillus thiaminolyticus]|uniref:NAD(P)H-dependent oxidoreductase n=1 Tax=Paenibacillus thiaminolyticus TaxID=49283 RepID=UPI0016009915|nr:NAD(P)H-dependent oxidoreductase [Paenibacillus thiaminolyticus]